MSAARATLTLARLPRSTAERAELAAWLRGQAEYLLRAVDFMPTVTFRLIDRSAPPTESPIKPQHWRAGRLGGRAVKHCRYCGEAGHTIRTCPEKKLAEMEAQKA